VVSVGVTHGQPITVVVVTWNSASVLGGLLDSLPAGMEGTAWTLVIADNGSADGTLEVARQAAPDASLVELGRNRGFAAAVNRAVQSADVATDILLLNPDVRLAPRCAARLAMRLRTSPQPNRRVGIAVPRLLDGAGEPTPTLRHEPSIPRVLAETILGARRAGRWGVGETILASDAYSRPTVAPWASGAAMMISRECLSTCGAWDESFFLYSEDTEFALRARERGFLTELAPDARAVHLGGASRRDPRLWSLLAVNKWELYRRRHGPLRAGLFRVACVARELRQAAAGHSPGAAAARALMRSPARR